MAVGENPADLYHQRAICYAKISQLNEAHADCDKSIEVYTYAHIIILHEQAHKYTYTHTYTWQLRPTSPKRLKMKGL